jgi:hypothetical protein
MSNLRLVRLGVISGVVVALLGLGMWAVPALAQENPNRPTAEQPSPGTPFGSPKQDKPWSYNWVARPLFFIVIGFIFLLIAGFVARWIGLGRRTT